MNKVTFKQKLWIKTRNTYKSKQTNTKKKDRHGSQSPLLTALNVTYVVLLRNGSIKGRWRDRHWFNYNFMTQCY